MSSVHGIGVDLVDVGRIRQSIEEFGERFLHRVFTESERTYCDARARRFEHYAGRFAAKEAVLKALGTGWNHQTHFLEVEIIPADGGPPGVQLGERMESLLPAGGCHWLLSISHTEDTAMAQAMLVSD
ncbi:MAG: holo-ACP synthase [Candidatus Latescibacteria bacterium]|nr:holo-ACP synthase [Candidatus Latescibacterota bacterium]